jgi:hypothetical protein
MNMRHRYPQATNNIRLPLSSLNLYKYVALSVVTTLSFNSQSTLFQKLFRTCTSQPPLDNYIILSYIL